jgi:hypothetical protein
MITPHLRLQGEWGLLHLVVCCRPFGASAARFRGEGAPLRPTFRARCTL